MQSSEISIYSRKQLLQIIYSWKTMIERNGKKWPEACLHDLESSINFVLQKEGVMDDYE